MCSPPWEPFVQTGDFFRLLICAAVARYPAEQEGIVRYSLNLVRIPPQSAVIWCKSRTFQLRSYLDPCATTEAHRNTIALCRPPPRHNPTDWQVVYDGAHGIFSLLHIHFPPYVSDLAWGSPHVILSFCWLILLAFISPSQVLSCYMQTKLRPGDLQ